MTNLSTETLFDETETANSKQIAILKKHFPQCFDKDGHFQPEKMMEVVKANEVDMVKESYSLNWLGKAYARLLTNLPPQKLLKPDTTHNESAENSYSGNILIKGDNLEVLKHLVNGYREKIKMIYIDPPYNTGSDGFVYQDNFKFTVDDLSRLAGIDKAEAERILSFNAKGSNSHSAWLTFMYPRLYIARELMREDGVIFISIDDNEQAQLKLLCDEVFGEENFIACLPVIMNLKGNQDTFGFADTHEYCLAYGKKISNTILGLFDVDEEQLVDEWLDDEYGLYKVADNLRATGVNAPRSKRPNLWYPIFVNEESLDFYITEDNRPLFNNHVAVYPINPEGEELSWYWQKSTFESSKHNLILKKTKNGWQFYRKQRPKLGDVPTKKPKSIWYKSDYSTSTATTDLKKLMGNKVFSSPKPVPFLGDLIKIGLTESRNQDIVLDFFAGSATTAHAVIEQNVLDNKERSFITLQIDEPTYEYNSKTNNKQALSSSQEAFDAGYETVFDITKARITKAAQKIAKENPDYQGDLGFKIYETINDFRPKVDDDLAVANESLFDDMVLSDEQYQALLTTWMLYDNNELTADITSIDLQGYNAELVNKNLYLIASDFGTQNLKCLLDKLDKDKSFAPDRIIVNGYNFDTAIQMELNEAIRSYQNKKKITINIIVRY